MDEFSTGRARRYTPKRSRNPPPTPLLSDKRLRVKGRMSDFLKSPPPRVAAPVDQAQLLDKAVTLFALALVVTALYVGRAVFIPIAIAIFFSASCWRRLSVRCAAGGCRGYPRSAWSAACGPSSAGSAPSSRSSSLISQRSSALEFDDHPKIASTKVAAGRRSLERAAAALRNIGGQITEATPGAGAELWRRRFRSQRAAPQNKEQPVPVEVRQRDPLSLDRLQSIASTLLGAAGHGRHRRRSSSSSSCSSARTCGTASSGWRAPRDLQRTTAAMDDAARRLSRFFLVQIGDERAFGVVHRARPLADRHPEPAALGLRSRR